jgi:hypothetical protein
MNAPVAKPYPGDECTAAELLELAHAYHCAAKHLIEAEHMPIRAPIWFVATHGIELYLNAFLLQQGHSHEDVRGLHHDFDRRAQQCIEAGLVLKKNTSTHLVAVRKDREYLQSRYAPAWRSAHQPNRLLATLDEVAAKVRKAIGEPAS